MNDASGVNDISDVTNTNDEHLGKDEQIDSKNLPSDTARPGGNIERLVTFSPRHGAAGGRRPPLETPAPQLILLPHAPSRPHDAVALFQIAMFKQISDLHLLLLYYCD